MSSPSLQAAFERLLGRAATADEVKRLVECKRELGISDDDALWIFVLYNESFFQRMSASFASAQKALDHHMQGKLQEYRTKILQDISAAGAKAIRESVAQNVRSVNLRWLAICSCIFLVVAGASVYGGRELGLRETEKAKIDAAWRDGYGFCCYERMKSCAEQQKGSAPR